MTPVTAALIVLTVAVVLLAAAGAGLLRKVRELELAVYRGVGLRFTVPQLAHDAPRVTTPGRVAVVAKLTRHCPVCVEVMQAMEKSAKEHAGALEYVVVGDDPEIGREPPPGLTVITDLAVWRAVQVPFVPALLIVDGQGIAVDSLPAGSGEAVADIVERALKLRVDDAPTPDGTESVSRKVKTS
jgi:thiol-disulfide isomerase/thioredoxin